MESITESKEKFLKDLLKVNSKEIKKHFTSLEVIETDQTNLLKCNICLTMPFDPIQCGQCQNIYCHVCIDHWKYQGQDNCPVCNKPITIMPLPRIVKIMYNDSKVKGCPV